MSKIKLILILLSPALISFGQNWKLLDETKTYFFKHSDSLYITNTIKTDSTLFSASDSTFYIHTRLKLCDTCTIFPSGITELYHAWYPEIFGTSPFNNVASDNYDFGGNIIEHHAGLSDMWIFNASLGTAASVIFTDEPMLFGELDSIKIIQLSTLDTIIISKNHGVIRYPDFENPGKYFNMVGYHEGTESFGEYLPNFWRIYDFDAGDVFCYETGFTNSGTFEQTTYNVRLNILEDLSSSAFTKYRLRLVYYQYEFYFDWDGPGFVSDGHSKHSTIDTFSLSFDSEIFENTFSGFCSNNYDWSSPALFYSYPFASNTLYSELLTASHSNDGTNYLKYAANASEFDDSLIYFENYYEYYSEFQENLGRTFAELSDFEVYGFSKLIGYIKNEDTTGTIYNFPDDLGLDDEDFGSQTIYPNPAKDFINFKGNADKLVLIELVDFSGNVLDRKFVTDKVDVSGLSSGHYIIRIIDANSVRTSHFIKE